MNKRAFVLIVAVVAAVALLWFGGRALWDGFLEMHGRGHIGHGER